MRRRLAYYCRLVDLHPRNYDYWFNLGVTYQRTGKLLDSAAAYQNAASLRPDATAAHINLAAVYHEMGDLQSSCRALDAALAVAPERTDLRYQRAVAIEEQGLAEEAESLYAELAGAGFSRARRCAVSSGLSQASARRLCRRGGMPASLPAEASGVERARS